MMRFPIPVYLSFIILLINVDVRGQDSTKLTLFFTGDIMQHDSQINAAHDAENNTYDYAPCFQYVKPYIETADLAFGNLELTLAGPPYTGYPQFSAPDQLLRTLKEIGYDVLVTANNHALDRGRRGLERTIMMLDSAQIMHTGTFSDTVNRLNDYPLVFSRKGIRIALLNYTYGTNGIPTTPPNVVNRIDTAVIAKDLAIAKVDSADVIIAFLHWGTEYERLPNDRQKEVADFCLSHGAMLVIGSHPHVIQPVEWQKEKNTVIAWSLGNFVSGQRKEYTDGGLMLRVELSRMPQSGSVHIDSVGYLLEWVYRTRDKAQNYYILPAPVVENDTARLVADDSSKAAQNLFLDDSRSWLGHYNRDVTETSYRFSYRVMLRDSLCADSVATPLKQFQRCVQGDFESDMEASRYIREMGLSEGSEIKLIPVRP